MIKKEIDNILKMVLEKEEIPFLPYEVASSSFGDYSTNISLRIGSHGIYQTPMEVANLLVAEVKKNRLFSEVTITKPGFINFQINQKEAAKYVSKILEDPEGYGSSKVNSGKIARVEFVSANPTGPLHIGNARGGPIGDVLAQVLSKTGYTVTKEYYDNNIGTQIDLFGSSLIGTIKKEITGQSGDEEVTYKGEYMDDLAREIKLELKLIDLNELENRSSEIKDLGVRKLFEAVISDCRWMGISFDEIYHENNFQSEGLTEKVIKFLTEKGLTKSHEGALWFAPRDSFLEDKEAVLVRSDGRPTYFADDIAYHKLKFDSKPDLVVNVLGSNHHSHAARLQAAISALGFDVTLYKVILYQYVRVKSGKDVVKMAKREGNFVTASEVLTEVGKDAFRFLLLQHSPNSHLDFDLELAKKESSENPIFYVQYAHARISSLLAKAPKLEEDFDPNLLTTKDEFALIKKMLELPSLVEEVSTSFAVQKLTFYSMELADLFHKFYESCRVISEDSKLTYNRLQLLKSCQITLANTLNLLGVSAPEKM